jgi:EpsI family protein
MTIRYNLAWGTAAFLLLFLGVYIRQAAVYVEELPLNIAVFPIESGGWKCDSVAPEMTSYTDPNVRRSWVGNCKNASGAAIEVYVGYADRGVRVVSPALYYSAETSHRWSYVFTRETSIEGKNQSFEAAICVLQHATGRKVALLYWYQIDGALFADEYRYRFNLTLRKLMRRPSASVVVRLSVPIEGDSQEEAFQFERELAAIVQPVTTERLR